MANEKLLAAQREMEELKLTLKGFVESSSSLLDKISEMSSDLERKYGKKTLITSVDNISELADKKRSFLIYVNDMRGALKNDLGIDIRPLKSAIIDGNDIGILSELAFIESKTGKTGVISEILQSANEDDTRDKLGKGGNYLISFLTESTFFFKDVRTMTRNLETRISDLFGPEELASLSEKINFITTGGSVQLYDGEREDQNAIKEIKRTDLSELLLSAERNMREELKPSIKESVMLESIPSLLETAKNEENGTHIQEEATTRTL